MSGALIEAVAERFEHAARRNLVQGHYTGSTMAGPDPRRYLPADVTARISRLEVEARTVVEGFLSGMHRSPYFGQSIEFAQHREYAPGDDTRRVDWKVWSRTDRYFVKQYEEETNLTTSILLDGSESMLFGSGNVTKFEYGVPDRGRALVSASPAARRRRPDDVR